jgi:hypothetical protein
MSYHRDLTFQLLQKRSFHVGADDFIPHVEILSIGSEITRLDLKSSPGDGGFIFFLKE